MSRLAWRADIPLKDAHEGRILYGAWLAGEVPPGPAADGPDRAMPGTGGPPPLLAGGWRPLVGREDPDVASHLEALARGRARAVVTGQQPGRLGGPLYTLYKIATAVAVARRRTAAGKPAVPVYWCGDADDDLDEAFAPRVWDPGRSGFLSLERGPGRKTPERRPPMVGRLGCRDTVQEEARWLAGRAETSEVAGRLAELWSRAVAEDWSWSRLQSEAVGRFFPGAGVIVVSGDDPAVHGAAAPLYRRIRDDLRGISAAAADRGEELEAAGYHAQLGGRSLARPLFRVDGDGRAPLGEDEAADPRDLRPGVLLRSPIQDWLLEPAAVVVGPGELAYLKQLEPVYRRLGIPRSPLVPRLGGWIAPAGVFEPDPGPDRETAARLAARAGELAGAELRRILEDELGADARRASSLAQGRVRRFVKGAGAMLGDEAVRQRRRRVADLPAWLFPDGGPQERTLAAGCAVALWGDGLLEDLAEAAADHLARGGLGDWRRYRFDRPEPAEPEGEP